MSLLGQAAGESVCVRERESGDRQGRGENHSPGSFGHSPSYPVYGAVFSTYQYAGGFVVARRASGREALIWPIRTCVDAKR